MKIKMTNQKLVSEDYEKLLWLLELNPEFEKHIIFLRKKQEQITDEDIVQLLDEFKLPQNLLKEMKAFIVDNSIPPLLLNPGIEIQSLGLTKDVLLGKTSPKGMRREVRIIITNKISKTKFVDWVKENWESIEFDMETLELSETKIPRWEYFDLVKQIVQLRDVQHLTFKEITEKLDRLDQDYIKTLYHRYTKWIKPSKIS
jgi:hypothetical protein